VSPAACSEGDKWAPLRATRTHDTRLSQHCNYAVRQVSHRRHIYTIPRTVMISFRTKCHVIYETESSVQISPGRHILVIR